MDPSWAASSLSSPAVGQLRACMHYCRRHQAGSWAGAGCRVHAHCAQGRPALGLAVPLSVSPFLRSLSSKS